MDPARGEMGAELGCFRANMASIASDPQMPRSPRCIIPGLPHHVVQRGNNRCAIFAGSADHEFFRDCLERALQRHACRLHAYVLMTNHVHLLMTPSSSGDIGRMMQSIGRRYVHRFNGTQKRTGALWQGRFRSSVVDSDRYLFACCRYIELNPVRAGLVADPADYRWSSYHANALGSVDPLVTTHELYSTLGDDASSRRRSYRALFGDTVDDATIEEIRAATHGGRRLSVERLRQQLSAAVKRSTQSEFVQ
jgi:putative transposase